MRLGGDRGRRRGDRPGYVEPGRLTIDSLHWTRTPEGIIPVAQSEFAKDASFGYRSSDLRDWVEEKTGAGSRETEIATITLTDIRVGGPDRVVEIRRSCAMASRLSWTPSRTPISRWWPSLCFAPRPVARTSSTA